MSQSSSEYQLYETNKKKMFKTTIAIASTYGVVALVLFILAAMNTRLSSDFLPFIVTIIGGMLLVLAILVYQIVRYKPSMPQSNGMNIVCPDYWLSFQTDKGADDDYKAALPEVQALMKYQCRPDPNVFTSNAFGTQIGTTGIYGKPKVTKLKNKPAAPQTKLVDTAASVYNAGYNSAAPNKSTKSQTGIDNSDQRNIRCDKIYPMYMASYDSESYPDKPNTLRCEYAKQCQIPWSGVCPKRI